MNNIGTELETLLTLQHRSYIRRFGGDWAVSHNIDAQVMQLSSLIVDFVNVSSENTYDVDDRIAKRQKQFLHITNIFMSTTAVFSMHLSESMPIGKCKEFIISTVTSSYNDMCSSKKSNLYDYDKLLKDAVTLTTEVCSFSFEEAIKLLLTLPEKLGYTVGDMFVMQTVVLKDLEHLTVKSNKTMFELVRKEVPKGTANRIEKVCTFIDEYFNS